MPLPTDSLFFKCDYVSCIIWDILMLRNLKRLSEVTVSLDVFIFAVNYSPVREGSPPQPYPLSLQTPQ